MIENKKTEKLDIRLRGIDKFVVEELAKYFDVSRSEAIRRSTIYTYCKLVLNSEPNENSINEITRRYLKAKFGRT